MYSLLLSIPETPHSKMKEDWQPMCGKDNKVFEAEPWRSLDFGLKNRSQQNTEIYKVGSQHNTVQQMEIY